MKRSTSLALTLLALLVALTGCGASDSDVGPMQAGTGGVATGTGGAAAGAGGAVGAGGAGGRAGVSGTGGRGGTGGVGGMAGGSAQTGGGGTSGMNAGAGGGMSAGSGGTVAPGGMDPIIPEVSGDCPEFQSGTNSVTVLGISATVIAGEKSAGTGPLLFYFYGTFKAGGVGTLPGSIQDDVASQGGIVFAPDEAMNTGGDCSGTGTFGIDDFKVSDQVVACAVKNYGIDPRRIYATGCSAGGLTTGCMGIMRSNYIAAVAPNSGGVTIGYGALQNPAHAPDAITMNGGTGDNVIVNFGETSEGYDNYILKYGGFAVNCIHGSGHCGAPSALYESAWQFLKDHPFGTKPSPYAGGLPSGFHETCKIFEMTDMAPLGGF